MAKSRKPIACKPMSNWGGIEIMYADSDKVTMGGVNISATICGVIEVTEWQRKFPITAMTASCSR